MVAVILLFVLGFAAGLLARRWIKRTAPINWLVTATIWLLLFVMGIGVGNNSTIIANLHTLGLWALLIAVGATAGSILCVVIISKVVDKYSRQ